MTEEIIIDGVNVAECEHFDKDSSLNNCLAHCIPYPECTCYESCDEHPNCYYKQLKRLKEKYFAVEQESIQKSQTICYLYQENEALTFKLKLAQADYEASEQENKELRQQYNCYACDTCQGKEDYRNMKRHCENAIKTVHTYRSALEEVRDKIQLGKITSYHDYEYINKRIDEVLGNDI